MAGGLIPTLIQAGTSLVGAWLGSKAAAPTSVGPSVPATVPTRTAVAGGLGAAVGAAAGPAAATLIQQAYEKLTGTRTTATAAARAMGIRRRRRMNVCNAHALRRSIRRVQGFSRFARKSFILEKRVKLKKRRR